MKLWIIVILSLVLLVLVGLSWNDTVMLRSLLILSAAYTMGVSVYASAFQTARSMRSQKGNTHAEF